MTRQTDDASTSAQRKLREDLSAEQRERAEKTGRLEWKSARYAQLRRFEKFIPSKEQH